ncbi:MAG: molybdenum cofactor sulfurase [Pseudomonadota bacterium]
MSDLLLKTDLPEITKGRRFDAEVDGLFKADGKDFVTRPVDALDVSLQGIPGDIHGGFDRKSGGREPWYPRGTVMRNERQVSIVCRDELAVVAETMGLDRIEPEWIGANITLKGVPHLSFLPPSTLLFFEGGATIKVDFMNGPCRFAGEAIARHVGRPGDDTIALGFPKAAKRRRGVVAWIEKAGTITMGEKVRVQVAEQWIYPGP